jgi:hypothetical protein
VRTFAVSSFDLGDLGPDGTADPNAWKAIGFDVDHLNGSVAGSCQLAQGVAAIDDGNNAIDNSFGENIVPILGTTGTSPSKSLNQAAIDGRFTLLIQVTGFTDDPAQTNTGLSGHIFFATPFGGDPDAGIRPTFTQADDWPYRNDTHVDLPSGYVTSGTFVNAGTSDFPLALALAGSTVLLTIHHGTIAFRHDPANQALTGGTIAGVVDTQELVKSMDALGARFTPPLCPGGILDLVKQRIAQSSDILNDGTQDPTKPCNGTSIGISFEAKRVANPTKPGPPSAESQDNPCK